MVKKPAGRKNQVNLPDLDISQPGSVPPVNISENPFVPTHISDETLESQLPGSDQAPSASYSKRNPYDLPCNSKDEKPNLTVDSISPEILADSSQGHAQPA
ncbi:hypothetical protein MLD38_008386 [Melastoma candidum]|uniref:Uncharacterized protein n=1 Tax=Melastoma candidum TaxID=119954 RepID=A0ACB9RVH6_9MYRT|nr:hypothetical protein MLD38_008386 [Melastoma candidum]